MTKVIAIDAKICSIYACRFEILKNCWEYNPVLRPTFSNLVENIGKELEMMSDYLYVSTFLDEQGEI